MSADNFSSVYLFNIIWNNIGMASKEKTPNFYTAILIFFLYCKSNLCGPCMLVAPELLPRLEDEVPEGELKKGTGTDGVGCCAGRSTTTVLSPVEPLAPWRRASGVLKKPPKWHP
jgi:hypothetical protein